MRRGSSRFAAVLVVGGLAAAACTSGSGASPDVTTAATTTTISPARIDDDTLTIGLLLPTSNALLGQGLIHAAEQAIARVNEAGGVLGKDVVQVSADEGSTDSSVAEAIVSLLDQDVDAIVGPSSSKLALSSLDDIVEAGVLACSPTASALALDDFPDNSLFFRTIPSDSLQAVAIADEAERAGRDVALVYIDDAYGRPFAAAVESALENKPIDVVETLGFNLSNGRIEEIANEVSASSAQVLILIANNTDGPAFLETLSRTPFESIEQIVVNDAMRNPTSEQLIETLDPDLRELIRGIAPQAQSPDPDAPFDPPGLFGVHAHDCVNLIALASYRSKSDDPRLIAQAIPGISTGGVGCTSFAQCVTQLDAEREINYNGPDGLTELFQVGEPARAIFDRFEFDDTGKTVTLRPVEATAL